MEAFKDTLCVMALKVEHCQTLRVVSTFTGQNESTIFKLVKASS